MLSNIRYIQAGKNSGAIDHLGNLYIWGTTSLGVFQSPKNLSKDYNLNEIKSLAIGNTFTVAIDKTE